MSAPRVPRRCIAWLNYLCQSANIHSTRVVTAPTIRISSSHFRLARVSNATCSNDAAPIVKNISPHAKLWATSTVHRPRHTKMTSAAIPTSRASFHPRWASSGFCGGGDISAAVLLVYLPTTRAPSNSSSSGVCGYGWPLYLRKPSAYSTPARRPFPRVQACIFSK